MKKQEKETKDTEKEAETNIYYILHTTFCIVLFLLLILSPLKYYKYIAWILLAISLHWIICNGCIIDTLHYNNCNNNSIPTNNITPILKLLNKSFGNYIDENYLKNTMRPTYIIFFICTLALTIMIYRLIYKIEFFYIQTDIINN